MQRTELAFGSGGSICRAWRYLPDEHPAASGSARPCVVMAHGFGLTRDASLAPYAERFATAGMHVLLFDYRQFGASDGAPRQVVAIRRQLQDYAAAVEFARSLSGVDESRIAVWGTSFSGGHALVTAATVPGIAAAVCQCPMVDGLAAVRRIVEYAGLAQLLRLAGHGLLDASLAPFGRAHYVPTVGPPGSLAIMSSPDADAGYRALAPDGYRCEVAARIALTVGLYRPVRYAGRAGCPVLVQICERDSVAPASAAEAAVRRLGERGEVRRYPVGHFEPYCGAAFERSIGDQLEFLQRRLAGRDPA